MENFTEFEKQYERRRDLLPWWIKVFCWLFMFSGIAAIVLMILSFFDIQHNLKFYGINGSGKISWNSIIVFFVFLLHGFTAYSLWFEKKYAVSLGIMNAILGITLCLIIMFLKIFSGFFSVRLELVPLIIFLIKLIKIKQKWDNLYLFES